jgi:hypothetical protein
MFLAVTRQHASGACKSHSCLVLSLCEASRKYVELSPSTPPFLTLQFHEKDLTRTPNLLRIRLILPPLRHILSAQPHTQPSQPAPTTLPGGGKGNSICTNAQGSHWRARGSRCCAHGCYFHRCCHCHCVFAANFT